MTWHSLTQRNASMIHDGNHSEGFTYDSKGRLVFTDPDGETTLFVRGQGEYATGYSEPTAEPVGKSVVEFAAALTARAVIGLCAGVVAVIAFVVGAAMAVLT